MELARTMLSDANLPKYFWADAVSTACYVGNRVIIRPIIKKTPYELFKGRKPNIAHFHIFGCKCFVLNNDRDNLEELVVCDDDDPIDLPPEELSNDQVVKSPENQEDIVQQDSNINDLPKE